MTSNLPSPYCDVHVVPVRQDNFSYVLVDRETNEAACVDPYDPSRILKKVESLGAQLTTVLTTHHHHDHSGGNDEMKKLRGDLRFIGSGYEATPQTTYPMKHEDTTNLGSLKITTLHAPCHTSGHLLYFVESGDAGAVGEEKAPLLFTGDTLFIGGCGRFFEGNASDMVGNMDMISKLPPTTLIYCGHEYTVKNLAFALDLEPENKAVQDKLAWAKSQIKNSLHTVPSVLREEMTYNPFMRYCNPAFQKMAGNTTSPEKVMGWLRAKKDSF